ncbi:hypothetical protein BD779DRAFT_1677242 [Infundibulicybe gibba]|nr:hypothetical protein BD779DRAFT_1677242 [Infundibulicybe gibba]
MTLTGGAAAREPLTLFPHSNKESKSESLRFNSSISLLSGSRNMIFSQLLKVFESVKKIFMDPTTPDFTAKRHFAPMHYYRACHWNKQIPADISHGDFTLAQFRQLRIKKAQCLKESGGAQHEYVVFDIYINEQPFGFLRAERMPNNSDRAKIETDTRQEEALKDYIAAVQVESDASPKVDFDLNNVPVRSDSPAPVHAPETSSGTTTPPTPSPSAPDVAHPKFPTPGFRPEASKSNSKFRVINTLKFKDVSPHDDLQFVESYGTGKSVYILEFGEDLERPTLVEILVILEVVSRMKDRYHLLRSNCYFLAAAMMKYLASKYRTHSAVQDSPSWGGALMSTMGTWLTNLDTAAAAHSPPVPQPSKRMSRYAFINLRGKIAVDVKVMEPLVVAHRARFEAELEKAEGMRLGAERAAALEVSLEEERQRAEGQQQRAEEERQRAEGQQQRAEEEHQRAEEAVKRAEASEAALKAAQEIISLLRQESERARGGKHLRMPFRIQALFHRAQDCFPNVVWEVTAEEEKEAQAVEGVEATKSRDQGEAEELRIDKLRKDLVFIFTRTSASRLPATYSSTNHENTTAIFTSHRFILISHPPYFHTALISWLNPTSKQSPSEPSILTLPSPPFTPAPFHFTLGFIYTGTLACIVQGMMHGLFHAVLEFSGYERLTGGKLGAAADNASAALQEFSNLPLLTTSKIPISTEVPVAHYFLKGAGKHTTPMDVFALLFAAKHVMNNLNAIIDVWADTVREMILAARKIIDDIFCSRSEACFNEPHWLELMEDDGVLFEDGE